MTGFLVLTFVFIVGCQAKVSFQNCGNPLLKINSITQIPEASKLSASSNIEATFTSTSNYADPNMRAVLEINVQKKIFWSYVSIPNFVFNLVAPAIEKVIPGVKHLKDNKFEIGCAAAKNFLKTCPPAPGTYTTNIPLDKPFKAIKSKAGAAGAFIGSGSYKVTAKATILAQQGNQELVCASFTTDVSL